MSRHYSLSCKTMKKPNKLIKQVCENQISNPGVSYVWRPS